MSDLKETQQKTGLRIYSEGVDGVEIHYEGRIVAVKRTKPLAIAFIEGAAFGMSHLALADRTTPAGGKGERA